MNMGSYRRRTAVRARNVSSRWRAWRSGDCEVPWPMLCPGGWPVRLAEAVAGTSGRGALTVTPWPVPHPGARSVRQIGVACGGGGWSGVRRGDRGMIGATGGDMEGSKRMRWEREREKGEEESRRGS